MQVSKMLESRAKDMKPERIEVASKAGFTFRAMQPPLHIPLMNLESDLAIVGPADESPFVEPLLGPAKLTVSQLLLGAPARRIEVDAKPELLPAICCIDNHLDNQNNDAVERRQKMPMASLAHIVLMNRALYASLKDHALDETWDLVGATEDLKAAYTQCPLLSSQIRVAITAVWTPHSKKVQFHKMYSQPFGAGHAVPNFCRIAEWAVRAVRRLSF
jgi:hypothetical protein